MPITFQDIQTAFDLEPAEARKYLESKGLQAAWNWQEVIDDAANRAFTVAKLLNLDLLSSVQEALVEAQKDGTTFEDFKKKLTPILQSAGWWGDIYETNPSTGRPELVKAGSVWRLRTIFRTNTQSAYAANRLQQQKTFSKRRPFWQYVAVGDERTRQSHLDLDGTTLPADSPFWNTHYPPNGFNCRCRVRSLSAEQVAREGLKLSTPKQVSALPEADEGFRAQPTDPNVPDLKAYPKQLADAYRKAIANGPRT